MPFLRLPLGIVIVLGACGQASMVSVPGPSAPPARLQTPRQVPALADWLKSLKDESQEPDLIEAASVIASHALKVPIAYETLPESLAPILAAARRRLPPTPTAAEIIEALNLELLPLTRGGRSPWVWLQVSLGGTYGYCLPNTVIYLVAADRLGLRLSHLEIPGHVLACLERGDSGQIRIETTSQGQDLDDRHLERLMLQSGRSPFFALPSTPTDVKRTLQPRRRRDLALAMLVQADPKMIDTALDISATPALLARRILMGVERREWEEVERLTTQAILSTPHLPWLYALRSAMHLSRNDGKQALEDAIRAQQLAPEWGPYASLESYALGLLGSSADAETAAVRGRRMSPHLSFVWIAEAKCLGKASRYTEARQCIDEAIRLDPLDPEILRFRASIWAYLGDEDQWEKDRQRAEELERRQR
jgi:tetratricopeptide (TPR) repeat protein